MKEIKLTNSALVAFVDDEDYYRINYWAWHLTPQGYAATGRNGLTKLMHRVVMGLDRTDFEEVRHLQEHAILDNRKSNLLILSAANHRLTRGPNQTNKGRSKYKGVFFRKDAQKWGTKLQNKDLGSFDSEEQAAKTYDAAARKIYAGAYQNFPDANPQ